MGLLFQSEKTVVILFRSTHKNLTNDRQRCLVPSLEVGTHYGTYYCETSKNILQRQFSFCHIPVCGNHLFVNYYGGNILPCKMLHEIQLV